jgi:hypothetical protein
MSVRAMVSIRLKEASAGEGRAYPLGLPPIPSIVHLKAIRAWVLK